MDKLAYKVKRKERKKEDENLYIILELSVMYPTVGILDPSFTKTGDKMRSQDENGTQDKNLKKKGKKKEGIKLVFSPKLVLPGVSPLVLDSPYLCFHCTSYFFGFDKLLSEQNKSYNSCELIPSFIK